MVEHGPAAAEIGIAAELRARGDEIVPAAELRLYAECGERGEHHTEILLFCNPPFPSDEGEVEVAAVVEDGAAARQPACENSARGFEGVHPTLRKSVLVAAEHHGVRVAPKIERRFAVAHPIEERGFYRLIDKHVVARASGEQQSPDRHDNSI